MGASLVPQRLGLTPDPLALRLQRPLPLLLCNVEHSAAALQCLQGVQAAAVRAAGHALLLGQVLPGCGAVLGWSGVLQHGCLQRFHLFPRALQPASCPAVQLLPAARQPALGALQAQRGAAVHSLLPEVTLSRPHWGPRVEGAAVHREARSSLLS